MNAGRSDEAVHQLADQQPTEDEPVTNDWLQRHEYVQAMGHVRFANLMQRIEQAYHQVMPCFQC